MTEKILIILINYNSSEHTIECVNSILDSDYKNFKILIIDNASKTDDTDHLKKINNDKTEILLNNNNEGFAAANNIGLRYAELKGFDYALILNNDTTVCKNTLTELLQSSHRNNANVVTGKILNYYQRNLIWYAGGDLVNYKGDATTFGFNEIDRGRYDTESRVTFASGCCMLIDKKTFQRYKLSENYFLYYEDVDYCSQLEKADLKIYYCPSAIIYHKESASTKKKSDLYSYYFSRNRFTYIRDNLKGKERFLSYLYSTAWLLKKLIMRDYTINGSFKGIHDFYAGVYGKCSTI